MAMTPDFCVEVSVAPATMWISASFMSNSPLRIHVKVMTIHRYAGSSVASKLQAQRLVAYRKCRVRSRLCSAPEQKASGCRKVQRGFVGRLNVLHTTARTYSEIERAQLNTLADLTSLALSGCRSPRSQ